MNALLSIIKNLALRGVPELVGGGALAFLVYQLVGRLIEQKTMQFCLSGDSLALALVLVVAYIMFAYRQPPPSGGDWRG